MRAQEAVPGVVVRARARVCVCECMCEFDLLISGIILPLYILKYTHTHTHTHTYIHTPKPLPQLIHQPRKEQLGLLLPQMMKLQRRLGIHPNPKIIVKSNLSTFCGVFPRRSQLKLPAVDDYDVGALHLFCVCVCVCVSG